MSSLRSDTTENGKKTPIEILRELKWSLSTAPSVLNVALTHKDPDISGELVIDTNSDTVEPVIEDIIRNYDAWMKPPKLQDDGIEIVVKVEEVPEPEFKSSGENNIRKRGGSHMLAIPPEAIEESGIELGERVEFYSRDGEILFTRQEN